MKEYYTPKIEEFHVGFEFERKNLLDKRKWIKVIFRDGESAEQYCEDIEARVKYLDKEDIEELGWKPAHMIYLHGESDEWTYYGKWFLIYKNGEVNIHNGRDMEDNVTYFDGIIKNKSELNKIMEMLNIK